jgi:hypothetical protein
MRSRGIFWWRVLNRGLGGLNSAAGLLGLVVLILGVVAGVTVPLVLHISPWAGAVIAVSALLVVVLEGSYRVWAATDAARTAAIAEAAKEASQAPEINAPVFWDNRGTVKGNEITNTYNAAPQQDQQAPGNLIKIGPGCGIGDSLVTVEFGPTAPPVLPDPLPSTPAERARLGGQLLALADTVETVMASWGQARHEIAAHLGVPQDEFMARMPEILAERSRIDDEAVARYNAECRPAVIEAYGHARTIGLADAEMERVWQTRLGAGARPIPARLRIIARRLSG